MTPANGPLPFAEGRGGCHTPEMRLFLENYGGVYDLFLEGERWKGASADPAICPHSGCICADECLVALGNFQRTLREGPPDDEREAWGEQSAP